MNYRTVIVNTRARRSTWPPFGNEDNNWFNHVDTNFMAASRPIIQHGASIRLSNVSISHSYGQNSAASQPISVWWCNLYILNFDCHPEVQYSLQCFTLIGQSTRLGRKTGLKKEVTNQFLITDPVIRQPGFDLERKDWTLLIRFCTDYGVCAATHDWRIRDDPSCACGNKQKTCRQRVCPLTKFPGGLQALHSEEEDSVSCLRGLSMRWKKTATIEVSRIVSYRKLSNF